MRFLRKNATCVDSSGFKIYQNVSKYKKLKKTESCEFLNNTNATKNSNTLFSNTYKSYKLKNIKNIITKSNISNSWTPKTLNLKNKNRTLELTKIVQSTKDRETFVIVDLTDCINASDIRKQLCRKLGIIELWSECRIFSTQIYTKDYDEELDDEKLIYARFYADNIGTLKFYVEFPSKKVDKNICDTISVYSIPRNELLEQENIYLNLLSNSPILLNKNNNGSQIFNNFFKISSNISNRKMNLESKIQKSFISKSEWDNNISIKNQIQFQKNNIYNNLSNQKRKIDFFDVFQNNEVIENVNFHIRKIKDNINTRLDSLLNQNGNLGYLKSFNNIQLNNNKHINVEKLQLSKKLNTNIITDLPAIFNKLFPSNLEKKLIKQINTLNLNESSEKSYQNIEKKNNMSFENEIQLKKNTYNLKNSYIFFESDNLLFDVYDENVHDYSCSKKEINKNILNFSTRNIVKIQELSEKLYNKKCKIKYSNNEHRLKKSLEELPNLNLFELQNSHTQDQTVSKTRILSIIEKSLQPKEVLDLSNSSFIDEIENDQEIFWAIKPKRMSNKMFSEKLKDFKINNSIKNISKMSIEKIFSNEATNSLALKNVENSYDSTSFTSSISSTKSIFEKKICNNDKWGIRPSTQVVYEHLEDFFPNHDLDKPIINQLVDLTNLSDTKHISDTFLTLKFISPVYCTNIQNCMKSIKVVAKEANEAQKKKRKYAKLWGIKSQEIKLNKDKNDYNLVETNIINLATFKWIKGKLIGKGRYGKVYLAMNATTGEMLAVKQIMNTKKI
ncbi:unnamed protein product [Pneumocystis jirovecii]|uniref:Protein kinase domain-containing protein n=1 Tax=Pneumocystis jirovecii TaxID=42068 RepID=L0PG71_PNEJI|nr:unnamed protein product [Pneumocystis jirovecii]